MSLFLYNLAIALYSLAIKIAALFQQKAALFIAGRKDIFKQLNLALKDEKRPIIWIHCSSLGEFEQGRSLIEMIRLNHPTHAIFLSFFSPSGYEFRKNYSGADYIFYLPIDTAKNAKQWIQIIQPSLAIFVKYEFWYHHLNQLKKNNIPTLLISAHFQPDQIFFKWYGQLFRKLLHNFQHIFVQDQSSVALLQSIQINSVSVAGDTRFDRAFAIAQQPKTYENIEIFKGNKKLLIVGSAWKEDIELNLKLMPLIQNEYKILLVPHEIAEENIQEILKLDPNSICLWESKHSEVQQKPIALVNSMGHLAFLYRYADIVWIGGGLGKNGIHNTIEPAVYGKAIFFGPNYKRFREAEELISNHAAASLSTSQQFYQAFCNSDQIYEMGMQAQSYVHQHLGATQKIYDYLVANALFNT